MRIFLLLLLLAGCTPKYSVQEAPKLTSIHIIDREGMTEAVSNQDRLKGYEQVNFLKPQPFQKVLRVYSRDEKGNSCAYITTYHPNGELKQYLEVVNNRAFGVYKEWHTNGVLKAQAYVVEGIGDISLPAEKSWVFDGESMAYDKSGALIASIPYSRGSLEGTSFYYHKNGTVWKELPYHSNLLCGNVNIYLENGSLLQTTPYVNGLKEGNAIRYWPDGSISSKEFYQNGLLLTGAYYDLQGELTTSISNGEGQRSLFGKCNAAEIQEYHHGVQEGAIQKFDEDGILLCIYHTKSGLKQGEEIRFYPKKWNKEPKPKLSLSWFQGNIQGLAKTWYENGVLESQKEMSENKKNGVSSAWYSDGQLMMIEEYDQGKLKKGDYFRKGEKKPVSQVINGEGVATIFDANGNYIRKIEYELGSPSK